jgi:UDP-2,4-diacetamido-2,4,6-trideoxy-beta-L-altropyranose hydrolase
MSLIILTEAGDNIGFGHYTRCYSILEYFQQKDLDVEMYINLQGEYPGIKGTKLNWLEEDISVGKQDSIIIDSYIAPEDFYRKLKGISKSVIVIDDYKRLSFTADLIINPNIFGSRFDYGQTKMASGKDYIILRKAFREYEEKKKISSNIEKVLITLGGSDFRNLLPSIMNEMLRHSFHVSVIAGNEKTKNQLKSAFSGNNMDICGFADEAAMLVKMTESDLVISGCGQTLHELAYLGVPVVGIALDLDQFPNQDCYSELGFLRKKFYWHQKELLSELNIEINELKSYEIRRGLSELGPKLINGNGIDKIYQELTSGL